MSAPQSTGLSRRTLLRGAGAALWLPWLDALHGESAYRPSGPRRSASRTVFVFAPNGMNMDCWLPTPRTNTITESALPSELPATLAPLTPLHDRLRVYTGLALDGARRHGDGPGDHARAAAAFLTCAHAKKTGGSDIELGISIDQVLAKTMRTNRFPSLELGMERGRSSGSCDSGYSCAYVNNISWRTKSNPVAKEVRPRAVFERLFGSAESMRDRAAAAHRRAGLSSVLDTVAEDLRDLRGRLGHSDREKLEQFADGVRAIERRLDHTDRMHDAAAGEPSAPDDPRVAELAARLDAETFPDRLALMYDLVALALVTDQTRVVTMMLGIAGSSRAYRNLGISGGHHNISHHGKDPGKLSQIAAIDRFHTEQLARFATTLRGLQIDGQPLLDSTTIVYASGISDGNRHRHHDLPVAVVGGTKPRAATRPSRPVTDQQVTGQQVNCPRNTPMANLYSALHHRLAPDAGLFADATGTVPLG